MPGFRRFGGFCCIVLLYVAVAVALISPAQTARADWPPRETGPTSALGISSPGPSTEATPDPATVTGDDTLPPVTVATGGDGLWHNAPAIVTFTATDDGSGVAYTEYKLDAADWVRATQLSLPAPANHSGDGLHTVLYRSADEAGNVEEAKSLSVGIDTVHPTTRAPSAATVMRYRAVTLTYEVLDAAPNGGTAEVGITIRSSAGTVVKTLTYHAKPVNTLLRATFACRLAKGSYRFLVYASDSAGNQQAAVAGNRLTVTAPWSSTLPFRFRVSGIALRDLDPSDYPLLHVDEPAPIVDGGPHDADGVRMSWYWGRLYNHVSAQAFYGLKNLASYTLTGDAFYLARAEAQAQRLISRRLLVGTAWFHPNDFAWVGMTPPWCSALGHGISLKLFTALFRVTGKPVYQQAAQGTFESYLRRGPSSLPWIVSVDADGYLWLQEYPKDPPNAVLNGHIFSAYGLHDYYRATNDPRALELFNGAMTTVLHYASWFRQPGWRSFYSFSREHTATENYHRMHVDQLLALYSLTAMPGFARFADDLVSDYPPRPTVSGKVRVVPGMYTGLRFDSAGRVVGRRTWRITEAARLPVTRRERIYQRSGCWFLTTSGPWTGYYLRERASEVYLPGVRLPLSYDPSRTLVFPGGHEYVAHTYDDDGAVTASLSFAPDAATKATVDRRAVVNGVDKVRVASGPLEGYWLRLGPAFLR